MAAAFALNPAQALAGVMDMGNPDDKKLYYKGVAPLMRSEDLYECEANSMMSFLSTLQDRATMYGWNDPNNGILQIPVDPAVLVPVTDNLIASYGIIKLPRIRAFEETYIATQVRAAQATTMLYMCLMNSLTQDAKKMIMVWREQYTVHGIESGNLLLKVIIRESHLDSNATTAVIRAQLGKLNEYMPLVNSNIKAFNQHVQILLATLAARGETSNDLLVNLFEGCMKLPRTVPSASMLRKHRLSGRTARRLNHRTSW